MGYQSLIELISDSLPCTVYLRSGPYQSLIELISDCGSGTENKTDEKVSISYRVNF